MLALLVAVRVAAAAPAVYTAWPFDAAEAQRRQAETAQALGVPVQRTVDLPGGGKLTLVLIPAGQFLMGAPAAESRLDPDESSPFAVTVARPFWLGQCEVTNAQFRAFAPAHDSRYIDTHWKDRVGPGLPVNGPEQPVVRVSCWQAEAFCRWLGQALGEAVRLPTEAEWEYACRAGTSTPYSCPEADLARYANFADASVRRVKPWSLGDAARNDGAAVSAAVGRYLPNPWGLHDMHGNVAEWCATVYQPYPLPATGPSETPAGERVVRGGSWDDRAPRVRSAFRLHYPPDYAVYNVGFRVAVAVRLP